MLHGSNQGSASAQYISEKKLGTKIAIIYKNDDVYSTGIYNSFMTKAKELGLSVVSTTTFTEDTQNDFSVQIADAKDNGADLIFLPMYYTPASLILRQSNDIGYKPSFFGVDGMDGILTIEGFDTSGRGRHAADPVQRRLHRREDPELCEKISGAI